MNIIVIGDSFSFGHGCKDRIYHYDPNLREYVGTPDFRFQGPSEYCWANLLQEEFKNKITVINKSFPGRSMQGMFWDLSQTFRKGEVKNDDVVFFTGTVPNRIEIPTMHDPYITASWGLSWHAHLPVDEKYKNAPTPTHIDIKEREQAQELYIKYLWNEMVADQLSFSALMTAWTLCQHNNIQFFWSMPEFGFYDKKLLKTFRAYASQSEIKCLMDYRFGGTGSEESYEYRSLDKHANEFGHQFYYDVEIRQIFLKMFTEII